MSKSHLSRSHVFKMLNFPSPPSPNKNLRVRCTQHERVHKSRRPCDEPELYYCDCMTLPTFCIKLVFDPYLFSVIYTFSNIIICMFKELSQKLALANKIKFA